MAREEIMAGEQARRTRWRRWREEERFRKRGEALVAEEKARQTDRQTDRERQTDR